MPSRKTVILIVLGVIGLAAIAAAGIWSLQPEPTTRQTGAVAPEGKRWQAVAPGRVEPASGEIRIAAPAVGQVEQVLVKAKDTVFAGEPLVRLDDDELRARLASAEAQVALRKRARNDQKVSGKAASRRRAEDAVADAEQAVFDAQAALDRAAIRKRTTSGSDGRDLDAARRALQNARDQLDRRRAELRDVEDDAPLPTGVEGQLTVARADLRTAQAALDKLTIRAPIAGTVLQVDIKPGETAAPSSSQPLLLLGDVSKLRVRAELDERDFREIKIGQSVSLRAGAFPGAEFAGRVAAIAPLVQQSRDLRGQRNFTDVDAVEVLIDLPEPGPLAVGMKADVYFVP
jgi:HlyD family secretion protein